MNNAITEALQGQNYSRSTQTAYIKWIRRFLAYTGQTEGNPGQSEAEAYLADLADEEVSASTYNQAVAALLFLFDKVYGQPLANIEWGTTERTPPRILSHRQAVAVVNSVSGDTYRLMAGLLYGGGLRVSECVALRVVDVDFSLGLLAVRDKAGAILRHTLLPRLLEPELKRHIATDILDIFKADQAAGGKGAIIPPAIEKEQARRLPWQFLFPTATLGADGRRGHVYTTGLHKQVKAAAEAAGVGWASCQTLRHSFAVRLLAARVDRGHVQELMGIASPGNMLIYSPLVETYQRVSSPLDTELEPDLWAEEEPQ